MQLNPITSAEADALTHAAATACLTPTILALAIPAKRARTAFGLACGLSIMLSATLCVGLGAAGPACAANLVDLPVLSSSNGVLDILMVARPAAVTSLGSPSPMGSVYDICPRPANGANICPSTKNSLYGGTRLALKGGDLLKVRLVNSLPELTDAKHASEAPYLASNPTNLHTHGMLVSPRYPTSSDPTYGDNIFVLTLNPSNYPLPSATDAQHIHSDLRLGYTDYKIQVPTGHPSGMYWFHPHAHGVALNQVSAGLAGMITVGSVLDYVCKGSSCASYAATIPVRHILLKDTQVVAQGNKAVEQDQQDPQFCFQQPQASETSPRLGYCPGATTPVDPGPPASATYPGGKWFFTLNGQPYPTLPVTTTQGEIWRITAASGSNSYDLRLVNASNQDMVVQVLSIDGVAVAGPTSGSLSNWLSLNSTKSGLIACPGTATTLSTSSPAVACATHIVMMPSSRVELWVAYRDATGKLVSPPASGAAATLRTTGYSSGGDNWPAVDLAQVKFSGPARKSSDPLALTIGGDAGTLMDPATIAANLLAANQAVGSEPACAPLAAGHARRIFFGAVTAPDGSEGFGLGYEEVDSQGLPVPGTSIPVGQFDANSAGICVPLSSGNTPRTEPWQLVNLADEDHNFHIHQLRFWMIKDPSADTLVSPTTLSSNGVAYDNLPLRHGKQACGTVQAWHDSYDPSKPGYKACDGKPIHIAMPFSIAGDFVYHCHILEHEDGGMMAPIHVRASPQ